MRTASAFARYRAGSTPRNGASASEINRREPKPVDTSKNSKNHPERRPPASCFAVQCDQISTLNENLLGSYSEHSCAHWHPHGSAKLSAKAKKRESVMSVNIPLDLQRKCEQRWAARFPQPVA